ncbi:dihydrolipoyl dehydrogenase [bacterium]|nr:dihydrolipoyl dehydrogenase [bacterium]
MSATNSYDCIVIGSGPGGYVAAIRAAQLGLKTACIEKESPGGICLNWGCIPTKALLKSAEVFQTMQHASSYGLNASGITADFPAIIKRSRNVVDKMTGGVKFLLKKNKVDLIPGTASLEAGNFVVVKDSAGKATSYSYKNVIIATGARAKTLPSLPVDGERVITYRHALALNECPKKLLVVGAGAIGIEFAYFYSTFGAEVTVVEFQDQILPIEDQDCAKGLEKIFKNQKIEIKTKTVVESLTRKGNSVNALLKSGDKVEQWSGDYCLVAVGVQGNVEDLGLEKIGIRPEKSFIKVDQYYRTGVPGVYAIGDVIGPPLLAHVASHEGIIAAEVIANHHTHPLDYTSIPGCTYCKPQVASIGMTEKAARDAGKNVRIGRFPFSASGKAVASNETDGFVKVVVDADIDEVLGVHILHPEATELIAEASVIRSLEGTATSVANTIHAHPTLSEAMMEAMADALGRAIHI